MVALFYDLPMVDVADHVCVLDGGQSVRDDEARTPLQQVVQSGLKRLFGTRIDVRRGFVENQNTRIGQKHAGKRDQLALTCGKRGTTLLHHRVISVRQIHDELVRMHRLRGRFDLGIGRIQLAVANVLAHIAGENERILQHDAHLPTQRFQRDRTHVMPVNRHRSFCNVVKTRQQVDDRGFAGTGRADQRNSTAWFNMQIDQIENITTVRLVTENHIVEIDATFDLRQFSRVRRVTNLRLHVKRFENTLQICGTGDQLIVEIADADNRIPEIVRIPDERDQHAGGNVHRAKARNSHIVDERDRHDGNGLNARPHEELDVHGLHPRSAHVVLLLLEGFELCSLLGEGLRGFHAGNRLVDERVEIALLVRQHLVRATLKMLQHQHPRDQEREKHQAEQCEPPIDHKHDHQGDQEREHVGNHIDQTGTQRVGKSVHIIDHANQDFAVRTRIEIAERQRLNMRENIATHIFQHELTNSSNFNGTIAQSKLINHNKHGHQSR